MKKQQIIKCPNCQAEYLPAEIYLPDALLGRPRKIEKDSNGKILNYFGTNMDLMETYRCDFCNRKFNVTLNPKFFTDSPTKDFTSDYSTKLTKPSLFLSEE